MYPLISSIVISAVGFIASVFFVFVKMHFSKDMRDKQIVLSKLIRDDGMRQSFIFLVERNKTFYDAQHDYTVLTLLLNGLSIVYTFTTAISLAGMQTQDTSAIMGCVSIYTTSGILSTLAFVFVILNIFLRPGLRVSQFRQGWRRLDKEVNNICMIISENEDTCELSNRITQALIAYYEIENSITVHEMN